MTLNEILHAIISRLTFHNEAEAGDLHAAVDEATPKPESPAEPSVVVDSAAPAAGGDDLDAKIAAAEAALANADKQAKLDELNAQLAAKTPTA